MKAMLDWLRSFLSALSRRRPKDSLRTTLLQIRADELEGKENADIKYLRWQLTKLRAENTDLRNRGNEVCASAAPLFHMPVEELRQTACRYQVIPPDGGTGWAVVREHCVFCGCTLETVSFRTERDALLYATLLQAAGHRPQNSLSCSRCCSEYLESTELPVE